jgi:hypothetical protein
VYRLLECGLNITATEHRGAAAGLFKRASNIRKHLEESNTTSVNGGIQRASTSQTGSQLHDKLANIDEKLLGVFSVRVEQQ